MNQEYLSKKISMPTINKHASCILFFRRMKYLTILMVSIATLAILVSCEDMYGDFLDKAPGIGVTEDTIFSSVTQMEKMLTACYENGVHDDYGDFRYYSGSTAVPAMNYNTDFGFGWCGVTDECDYPQPGASANSWNTGGIFASLNQAASWKFDARWPVRWTAIRQFYIMLNRVEGVPEIDPAYASQIKGEMKFLLALNYHEMFKRYGGVPIVTKAFSLMDDYNIRRSSLDSTVQFIITNCDEAAALLPDVWTPNWTGRATKGAALALKARTLLFAASPLFNTATPYLDMPNTADNRLICFGNYDVNRWKAAADAALAVLNWAPSGGVELVNDQGADKNYRYVWETCDNKEIILAVKQGNGAFKAQFSPWTMILPKAFGGWSGTSVTQNFIENNYDKRDGTPQTWADRGTDLNQKYDELDYRFAQSVGYNGSFWNTKRGNLQLFAGGLHDQSNVTGTIVRKWIPATQNVITDKSIVNWKLFRLAEFYLQYAEAMNEYNSTPPQSAYDAVNVIRARSGMPDLPTGLTMDEFRKRVRKEWSVEFFCENFRFWNIKRWMIAEDPGIMSGPMYGLKITKGVAGPPQEYSYERIVFETRVWNRYYYLFPFWTQELNKGYLVQNPGW
jgi:hypothetical protein